MRREIQTMQKRLEAAGFIVGKRDPRRNTAFLGCYMVAEPIDESLLPTENASTGGWCVVGDNLEELIHSTYSLNEDFSEDPPHASL